jgi:hypothetical protein
MDQITTIGKTKVVGVLGETALDLDTPGT